MTACRADAFARRLEITARASFRLLGNCNIGSANYDPGSELVAGGKVDQVLRGLAAAYALDVFDDLRDRSARLGKRGGVRRDGHPRMPPQRIGRGQRLAVEDIEVCVREMAGIELAQQVRDYQVRTAREIDHAAVLLEHGE